MTAIESRGIQRAHTRRYASGRVMLSNRGMTGFQPEVRTWTSPKTPKRITRKYTKSKKFTRKERQMIAEWIISLFKRGHTLQDISRECGFRKDWARYMLISTQRYREYLSIVLNRKGIKRQRDSAHKSAIDRENLRERYIKKKPVNAEQLRAMRMPVDESDPLYQKVSKLLLRPRRKNQQRLTKS